MMTMENHGQRQCQPVEVVRPQGFDALDHVPGTGTHHGATDGAPEVEDHPEGLRHHHGADGEVDPRQSEHCVGEEQGEERRHDGPEEDPAVPGGSRSRCR